MKSRNLFRTTLLLIASATFALLSAEAAFRAYIFGGDGFSVEKMYSVRTFGTALLVQPSPFPELIFEIKPNLDVTFKLVAFQTNSVGMRDVEYTRGKPPGVVRAAVLGDSYTMPSGVAIEDAYHSLLEARFNRDVAETRFEFLNFGVAGYSLRQYLGVMEHKALEYDPDLILVGYCPVNDHKIVSESRFKGPFVPRPPTQRFFDSLLVSSIRRLYRQGKRGLLGLGRARQEETRDSPFNPRQQVYLEDMFHAMREFSGRTRIPVVVINLSHQYDSLYSAALGRKVEAQGLAFLDTSLAFEKKRTRDYWIHRLDRHPNAAAHQIFAERIYPFLRLHLESAR